MATITLNSAARNMDGFRDASKIRAQFRDKTLYIRPTERKSPANLRRDEKLVSMSSGKLNLEGMDHMAGSYGLRADKYGWFALTPLDKGTRGPSAKVSA